MSQAVEPGWGLGGSGYSLGDWVEHVRWTSETPVSDLLTTLDEVAVRRTGLGLEDRLAFAGLVLNLRSRSHVARAVALLVSHRDNPWVPPSLAQLRLLAGEGAAAAELLAGALDTLSVQHLAIQARWLAVAAHLALPWKQRTVAVLEGSPVLDDFPVELDLGEPLLPGRRGAFAERMSARSGLSDATTRLCVDVLADRMESGCQFRSQLVEWSAMDVCDRAMLERIVGQAVAAADAGKGFSVVRLGDGEGAFLDDRLPHVGGALGADGFADWRELDDDTYRTLVGRFGASLLNADVVGVPDIMQCLERPGGFCQTVTACAELGVDATRIVPGGCDVNWALEVTGLAEALVSRCTGVIGPIDPASFRRDGFADTVEWIPIPGELLYYGGAESATTHWSVFDSVMAHDFHPGQLWLVGAGILGKLYCSAIRSAGAVAVDLGSVLDAWAGRQDTRGLVRLEPWLIAPYVSRAR